MVPLANVWTECVYDDFIKNSFCDEACVSCPYDSLNQYFNCQQCQSGFKLVNNSTLPFEKIHNNCVFDCNIANCRYCYYDFFRNAGVCKECNDGFLNFNNACVEKKTCGLNEIFNGLECQPVDECCETAEFNEFSQSVQCVWPKKGFVIDGWKGCFASTAENPGPCPKHMYSRNGENRCWPCSSMDGLCEECSIDSKGMFKCSKCSANLPVDSSGYCQYDKSCPLGMTKDPTGACMPCPYGCAVCKDSWTCMVCKEGLFYNAADGSCSDGQCSGGYFLDFASNECMPCISNCNNCSDASSCNVCNYGFDLSFTDKTCKPSCWAGNCQKCVEGKSYSCEVCQDGYVLQQKGSESYCTLDCNKSVPNCQYCWQD